MKRRSFLIAVGSTIFSSGLGAVERHNQQSCRIGVLFAGTIALRPQIREFWQAMRKFGYEPGRNLIVDVREAHGDVSRLPDLAGELIALQPDVVLAVTRPSVIAVANRTQTIPIVFAIVSDPLSIGIVNSLARPERNVTGPAYTISPEIVGKRLELLSQLTGANRVVGILWNAQNSATTELIPVAEGAAQAMNIKTHPWPFMGPSGLKAALGQDPPNGMDSVLVMADPVTFDKRGDIIAFSLSNRLPTFHAFPDEAAEGALAGYGASLSEEYRRAATYVDRIFKGSKVSDLPIEQPTKFSLSINVKTARAIGVEIPSSMMAQADELIE